MTPATLLAKPLQLSSPQELGLLDMYLTYVAALVVCAQMGQVLLAPLDLADCGRRLLRPLRGLKTMPMSILEHGPRIRYPLGAHTGAY